MQSFLTSYQQISTTDAYHMRISSNYFGHVLVVPESHSENREENHFRYVLMSPYSIPRGKSYGRLIYLGKFEYFILFWKKI